MSDVQSRIVNVIETTEGSKITYFTLEGVMIGGFDAGHRIDVKDEPLPDDKPKGGVIKSPTPKQVQRRKEKDAEAYMSAGGKLKHLVDDVA